MGNASSVILSVTKDEWRYWMRSKLALSVLVIGLILTLASVIVTSIKMNELNHQRQSLQNNAQETFLDQPDRHPHRMVHYGHYAFRLPSPLSMLDPGVDAYTGNSIFLEGHRQNSAMFAEQRQGTGLTKLGSLSPSFIVQMLAPLLLILIGYSTVSRERESQTLSFILGQGTSVRSLLMGKALALFFIVCLIMMPLVVSSLFAIYQGESVTIVASFLLSYLSYLLVWALIVLLFSAFFSKNSESFTSLIFLWVLLCIAIPRIASTTAATVVPTTGKLETDFAVNAELRKLGDSHNASDPAFDKLKASLLEQYDVERIEELPINFRGAVARNAEAELTHVLNEFAEKSMSEELQQTQIARYFGWLSPMVAVRSLSMINAGTSIETHHRFLRETEKLRFDFVQALNTVHVEKLDYQVDLDRSKDEASSEKARVSADNWKVLDDFEFKIDDAATRLSRSISSYAQLLLWVLILGFSIRSIGRRLQ